MITLGFWSRRVCIGILAVHWCTGVHHETKVHSFYLTKLKERWTHPNCTEGHMLLRGRLLEPVTDLLGCSARQEAQFLGRVSLAKLFREHCCMLRKLESRGLCNEPLVWQGNCHDKRLSRRHVHISRPTTVSVLPSIQPDNSLKHVCWTEHRTVLLARVSSAISVDYFTPWLPLSKVMPNHTSSIFATRLSRKGQLTVSVTLIEECYRGLHQLYQIVVPMWPMFLSRKSSEERV